MSSDKPLPNFIAFGNCLIDQSVKLTDKKILNRYKFRPNELGECSLEMLDNIIQDVKKENLKINVHPGGSALNTCRILNELGNTSTLFCGAISDDDNGRLFEDNLKKLQIETFLQTKPAESTGTCICLVHGEDRCCYANIGASKNFNVENLDEKLKDILNLGERVVFYIEGFFVTDRSQVCKSIVNQFVKPNSNITLAVNLSAPYIVKKYISDINYLIEHADIVFGNTEEVKALSKVNGFKSEFEYIGEISENLKGRPKTFVITNADKPIEVFSLTPSCETYEWNALEVRQLGYDIVDSTGAGDAFVAGFFELFLLKNSVRRSVIHGIDIASKKLRKIGAHL